MDLKSLFTKICINELPCVNNDGSLMSYTLPSVNALSKEAYERGDAVFYYDHDSEDIISGNPIYIYRCNFDLTEDEYNELFSE